MAVFVEFNKQDIHRLQARMTHMIEKITHVKRVDVGQALSDWQLEEMHRHRPFTMRSRARGVAATKIRPHSLYEMKRSARYQQGMTRLSTRVSMGKRVRRVTLRRLSVWQMVRSTRPILRHDLYLRLPRMVAMLKENLQWHKTLGPVGELLSELRVTGVVR